MLRTGRWRRLERQLSVIVLKFVRLMISSLDFNDGARSGIAQVPHRLG